MTPDERTLIEGHEPTLLMPAPGGQATVVTRRADAPPPAAVPAAGIALQRLVAGVNPLVGAAGVLLGLVPRLRATPTHADPPGLRLQLLEWVAEFESLCAASGVPRPKITAARYVLCSFIDEVMAQTPWGAGGASAGRTLLQEFHEERWGGEKAFQLLDRLGQDPQANADLLELFYICLQLGFEGPFRDAPGGRSRLDALAARVLETVRPPRDCAAPRVLSLHWQGAATPAHRERAVLPLWVLFAVASSLLLGLYLTLNATLDAQAQPVFRQLHAIVPALRIERGDGVTTPRIARALQNDIRRGAIEVKDEPMRSLLRLPADALFVGAGAQIQPGQMPLLQRVARALDSVPGQVAVIGHTDNQPVGSLQFPSQWHLSRERAQAVVQALIRHGVRAERLYAEGRGDAQPLVSGSSAEQRSRNRRIEIELRLPRPDDAPS